MSTENKDPVELAISEAQDGSAIVELPEGMLPDDENEPQEAVKKAEEPAAAEATDEDDHPNDSDEVREAKRARRRAKKDLIRKTNQEKDLRLQQLQRENEEFKRRLDEVENKTVRNDIARIDKNIEDSQVRLEYAKMKMSEAVSANDGQAMVEAQELFNAAKQEIQQLQGYKQQVERTVRQPQKRNDVQVPDPAVQRNAADWMKRNAWFKPGSQDRDVLVAQKHDEAMVAEGWDPTDADYWAELDSRLQKALPHRYNSSTDTDSSVRKPRNVVGSSGRESSAAYGGVNRNQFTLSPERVKAMKDAGAWDNPERKAKMIKQFMNYDRMNGRTN
jgi:hypothetical protein